MSLLVPPGPPYVFPGLSLESHWAPFGALPRTCEFLIPKWFLWVQNDHFGLPMCSFVATLGSVGITLGSKWIPEDSKMQCTWLCLETRFLDEYIYIYIYVCMYVIQPCINNGTCIQRRGRRQREYVYIYKYVYPKYLLPTFPKISHWDWEPPHNRQQAFDN